MDRALISLVLLKYDIITSDPNTWYLCDTYPKEVQTNWAWRCAADCEHLVKGHPPAEKYIEIAKKHRSGLVTEKELSSAYAATVGSFDIISYATFATHSATAPTNAVGAAHYAACAAPERDARWDLYTLWLIEELGAWEEKRALTSREAMVDQ